MTGNLVGTDRTGLAPSATRTASSSSAVSATITIGGATDDGSGNPAPGTGVGNVISGNSFDGVQIQGPAATGDVVAGNLIGLGKDGTTAVANGTGGSGAGVDINGAPANTIGGALARFRNVISGNASIDGILIVGSGADGNVIENNEIGTDKTGLVARPNGIGVRVADASTNTVVGASGAGNLISANPADVLVDSFAGTSPDGTTIRGNLIGTNASGAAGLGDTVYAVEINGGTNTLLGGTAVGEGNTIVASGTSATADVDLAGPGTTGTLILGNFIGLDSTGSSADQARRGSAS